MDGISLIWNFSFYFSGIYIGMTKWAAWMAKRAARSVLAHPVFWLWNVDRIGLPHKLKSGLFMWPSLPRCMVRLF